MPRGRPSGDITSYMVPYWSTRPYSPHLPRVIAGQVLRVSIQTLAWSPSSAHGSRSQDHALALRTADLDDDRFRNPDEAHVVGLFHRRVITIRCLFMKSMDALWKEPQFLWGWCRGFELRADSILP